MNQFALRSAAVLSIAIACAIVGVGIGFIQGAIVARHGKTDELLVFAGSAGAVGGVVALVLGPILYYGLKQRISFEQFCQIATWSLLAGCLSAGLLSIKPDDLGWASMFITPVVAAILAVSYAKEK